MASSPNLKAKLQPILIEWLDPCSHTPWQDPEEVRAMPLQPMYSLGWLVENSKDAVKVCLNVSGSHDRASDFLFLPRGCVVRMEKVSLPRKV